ncbi:MAG: hypothetical protein LBD30_06600, partial [Verrucomicrobiales bacterium]|nr:hypothetical protein [Verrucomicrobiales bacterium]
MNNQAEIITSFCLVGGGFGMGESLTINDQRSTINDQRSTINDQRSTINDQRSTINDQRST